MFDGTHCGYIANIAKSSNCSAQKSPKYSSQLFLGKHTMGCVHGQRQTGSSVCRIHSMVGQPRIPPGTSVGQHENRLQRCIDTFTTRKHCDHSQRSVLHIEIISLVRSSTYVSSKRAIWRMVNALPALVGDKRLHRNQLSKCVTRYQSFVGPRLLAMFSLS